MDGENSTYRNKLGARAHKLRLLENALNRKYLGNEVSANEHDVNPSLLLDPDTGPQPIIHFTLLHIFPFRNALCLALVHTLTSTKNGVRAPRIPPMHKFDQFPLFRFAFVYVRDTCVEWGKRKAAVVGSAWHHILFIYLSNDTTNDDMACTTFLYLCTSI